MLLFVAVSCLIAVPQAYAVTVDELQAQIDAKQAEIDELEANADEAEEALDDIVKRMYEIGQPSLVSAFTSDDFADVVNGVEYANTMYATYLAAVDRAEEAKNAIPAKQSEIDDLRKQIDNRVNRNPDTVQYSQAGQPWSGVPYWSHTIGRSGCGLCSYTVVVDLLTGADYTPDEMLKIRGDWSGTEATLDSRFGTPNGETHQQWSENAFGFTTTRVPVTRASLNDALSDDGESATIILARGSGVFKNADGTWRSSSGHFVVCYRVDENGNYHVQDSGTTPEKGTNVVYSPKDMDRLLSGTNAVLAFHN